MSELHRPLPTRVPVSMLLRLPVERPAPSQPSPNLLLAERAQGDAAARDELLPLIGALETDLAEAEARHAAELQATRELALQLAAALETLMATELAHLTHAVAAAVLTAEPATSVETLAALVADAVSGLPRGTLRVPPDTLERARALCPGGWALEAREGMPAGTVEATAGPALQQQTLAARLAALMEDRGG